MAERLSIIKALGNDRRAVLALMMIVLRPIQVQSKLAAVAFAA
ncbi:MAG: hypothetical protein ACRDHZ_21525 [Ktedonobacteraceae bacterium]